MSTTTAIPTLPDALQPLSSQVRWVMWRYELVNERRTKVPYASTRRKASSTNSNTWQRFDLLPHDVGFAGPGVMLGDELQGVDLDACIDADGALEPWAQQVVKRLNTYTEVSPSGRGLKCFFYGPVGKSSEVSFGEPQDIGADQPKRRELAYFTGARYFTVTGNVWLDRPLARISDADADWLRDKIEDLRTEEKERKQPHQKQSAPRRDLNPELIRLIAQGVSEGERSEQFHHAVRWCADSGLDADAIATLIEQYPEGIGAKYAGRVGAEVNRSLDGYVPKSKQGATWGSRGPSIPRQPLVITPLPSELEAVQALPMNAMPDELRPWISDVAERMQCPPDFVAVPMLIGAASLVARRVAIRPQQHTDWTERANLWGLIVGRPGMMKSPAMSAALAPLDKLEALAAEAHKSAKKQFQQELTEYELRKSVGESSAKAELKRSSTADIARLLHNDPEPEKPARERYIVNDATYEKLGELLSENPQGLMSVRDEMRGLLSGLGQEENAPARAFYLQAWSGGRYVFDRIIRGTTAIDDARLSMIGCIQPGPLSSFIRTAVMGGTTDDGLVQRFLICWPDNQGEWRDVDKFPDSAGKRAAYAVFERLNSLSVASLDSHQDSDFNGAASGLPYLRFAPDALELFQEWRRELEAKMRNDNIGAATEAALSKFRKHVPALALTLHVVDGHSGPVSLTSTVRALTLADYFESHATRAYASAVRPTVTTAKAILRKLKSAALQCQFTARDVYRPGWEGLTDRELVEAALGMLVSHGYLAETEISNGGRPTVVYTLNEGAAL
jgi:hypothetical protein